MAAQRPDPDANKLRSPRGAVPAPATPPLGTSVDDTKRPPDPSRFGAYSLDTGVLVELIAAEKPHLDPKLLQDTVPPTAAAAAAKLEDAVATTPRGGFAAPKLAEKIAVVASAPAPTSAPPVDTSRLDDTVVLPRGRSSRVRTFAWLALVVLLFIGGLAAWMRLSEPSTNAATATPPLVSKPERPAEVAPAAPDVPQPIAPTESSSPSLAADAPSSASAHPSEPPAHPGHPASPSHAPVPSAPPQALTVQTTPPTETMVPTAPAPSGRRKFHFSTPP